MDKDTFWNLIEQSRQGNPNCEEQVEKLAEILAALEESEIIEFDHHMADRRHEAYRWDIWGVAYIINGGCSDDGFEYFRCWLISQGREFYEAVLISPEHAATRVPEGAEGEEVECEELLYAADIAYEKKAGQSLPETQFDYPADYSGEPKGQSWAEDDLEELFPELCARFW